jgi:uncharacterized protein (DUF1778 family)
MAALRAEDGPAPERQARKKRKTTQVIVRMDPEQKAFLEEAAVASGRTLSDLMTEGARKEALQIMREEEEIRHWKLSRADSIAFVEALLAEPVVTEQMVEDYRKYLEDKAKYLVPEPDDEVVR